MRKAILLIHMLVFILVCLWIIQIINGQIPYIDQITRSFVSQVAGSNVHMIFSWITNFGGKNFVIPFTITMAIILFFMYKNVIPSLFFAFGTLGAHLLNELIKEFVERERPTISIPLGAEGFSFPSGHAMNAIVCYGLVTYFLTRKIATKSIRTWIWIFTSIVIFLIGISRFIVNVHYLTDIIAGYFFGSVYVFCLLFIFHKIYYKRKVNS